MGSPVHQSPPARDREVSFTLHLSDDLVPAVRAGRYRITASQSIDGVDTGDHLQDAVRRFEVRAPQFLLPPDMVHAVNPAPDSAGALSRTLPHLTLNRNTLPWLRGIVPGEVDTGPVEPRPPWLALLVFAPGELPGDPNAVGEVDTMSIGDLTDSATREPDVLAPAIPPKQVQGDPAIECETIRIPGEVFVAVCPREDELGHLAHRRAVRADTALRGEELAAGDFSVILANRMPNPADGRHVAHLVSLEGCRAALDTVRDGRPRDVRLVSLHRWSFECVADGHVGFEVRVNDLLRDDDNGEAFRDLALRLPVEDPADAMPPAQRRAHDRLRNGWVPLPYHVASGEQTYAWYRGPFTPTPAQPLPRPAPLDGWTDAGQLLAYDPTWGVHDTAWATAWNLGRSLALADDDFGSGLSAWRSRARYRAATLAQRLAGAAPDTDDAELRALVQPRARDRALQSMAADGAAARLLGALDDPPQATGTTRGTRTTPTTPPAAALHRVLTHERTRPVLRETLRDALEETGAPISAWFARLRLLHDVPFAHLVPDEDMLPPESLRLFHVDPGWITALQAGAESLGVTGTVDVELAALAAPWAAQTRTPDPSWPRAGILIRSALVREHPESVVRGWRAKEGAGNGDEEDGREAVRLLRRSVLEHDVLLVLFDQVPDVVELSEPPEGLSFGIDTHPVDDKGIPVINLRSLGTGEVPIGGTLEGKYLPQDPGEVGVERYLRPDAFARRVLDLRPGAPDGLVRALGARLAEAGQPGHATPSPAVLALQLVNAPFRQEIHTHLPPKGNAP